MIDWYADQRAASQEIMHLKPNWDSYSAPTPTVEAITSMEAVLKVMNGCGFHCGQLATQIDGGVSMVFSADGKYADMECTPEGDILAVTHHQPARPTVWEVPKDEIKKSVQRIAEFLRDEQKHEGPTRK